MCKVNVADQHACGGRRFLFGGTVVVSELSADVELPARHYINPESFGFFAVQNQSAGLFENKEGRIAPALFVLSGYTHSSASDWPDSTLNGAPVQKKLSTIFGERRWKTGGEVNDRDSPVWGMDVVPRL